MSTFLKRTTIFLAVASLLYFGTMLFMSRVRLSGKPIALRTADYYQWPGGTTTWSRFHEYDPTERLDAVAIGSSHVNQGYDPEVFSERGQSLFLLSNGRQSPGITYELINYYLDSTNCPLLIYDIYHRAFLQNGFECAIDLITNVPNNRLAFNIALAQNDLRTWNALALRLVYPSSIPDKLPTYKGRGFVLKTDSIKDKPVPRQKPKFGIIPKETQKIFSATIHLCQERGIPVVFSSHYLRKELREEYRYDLVNQYIDSIAHANGIPFLDFSASPGIDEQNWFSDPFHLNGTGARIFTNELVDTLKSIGYLGASNSMVDVQ